MMKGVNNLLPNAVLKVWAQGSWLTGLRYSYQTDHRQVSTLERRLDVTYDPRLIQASVR